MDMAGKTDKLTRSDEEWRARLTREQYHVARRAGTERPFSHEGFPPAAVRFHCVCCGAALFGREAKFDSGTGWPSFFRPLSPDALQERADRSLFGFGPSRTEVLCARCDAHLGHVFKDGPPPTGLRYCINGVVLDPREKAEAGREIR